jgi:hypothetical protein
MALREDHLASNLAAAEAVAALRPDDVAAVDPLPVDTPAEPPETVDELKAAYVRLTADNAAMAARRFAACHTNTSGDSRWPVVSGRDARAGLCISTFATQGEQPLGGPRFGH